MRFAKQKESKLFDLFLDENVEIVELVNKPISAKEAAVIAAEAINSIIVNNRRIVKAARKN